MFLTNASPEAYQMAQGSPQGNIGGYPVQPTAQPVTQPAQPERKRVSGIDIAGGILDAIASMGGGEPMYQRTLDARADRERQAEQDAINNQYKQSLIDQNQFNQQQKQNLVIAQIAGKFKQAYTAGGAEGLARIVDYAAPSLGISPEQAAMIKSNPEILDVFGSLNEQAVPEYDYRDIQTPEGPQTIAINRNDLNDRQVIGAPVVRQGSGAVRRMIGPEGPGEYLVNGTEITKLGDIYEEPRAARGGGGSGLTGIGKIPAGYGLARDAQGNILTDTLPDGTVAPKLVPLPGSKDAYTRGKDTKAEVTKQENRRDQARNARDTIDEAYDMVGLLTAGPGAVTSFIYGSPAKNLDEKLGTIRAGLGFRQLQQMREESPTGGALGQVTEYENKLLQSVVASLDPKQSPAQLKANLDRVRRVYDAIINEGPEAAQREFNRGGKRMKFNPATGEIE